MNSTDQCFAVLIVTLLFAAWWVYVLQCSLSETGSWVEHYKLQAANLKTLNDHAKKEYKHLDDYSTASNRRLIGESESLKLENQNLKSQIDELYHIKERLSKIKRVIDS